MISKNYPLSLILIIFVLGIINYYCSRDSINIIPDKLTIQSVSKNQTFWGDTITFYGKAFGEADEFTYLSYEDILSIPSTKCLKWNQITIKFIIPKNIHSGKFKIFKQYDTSNSVYLTIRKRPEIELIKIKATNFIMGSNEGIPDESPPHRVNITKDFYIGKYEVTQLLWNLLMKSNPSKTKESNHPVHNIKWHDAIKFCNTLSLLDGFEPSYIINDSNIYWNRKANGWRLPTEAEWELASGKFLYAGSSNPDEIAWFDINSANQTHPIGTKKPNEYGIYDMSGNVREWCWDSYDPLFYSRSETNDPHYYNNSSENVARGGGFSDGSNLLRRTSRIHKQNLDCTGLRIVRFAD